MTLLFAGLSKLWQHSSMTITCFIFFVLITLIASDRQEGCCSPGEPCWPTSADIEELSYKLGGNVYDRNLFRTKGYPYPAPLTAGNQPLFGAGVYMDAVYVQKERKRGMPCDDFQDTYCQISVRNAPRGEDTPAFVVWPMTAQHVQDAVNFAVRHNLCISVAGTGHDMQNRHSNDGGMFIRTSLLKSMEFDLSTDNEFGHAYVKLGAGVNFNEIQYAAAKHGKMVVSGWCSTVGIIGWSTGGGIGYGGNMHGLGADNILEAEIVTADGNLTKVNSKENEDLYWAIRGGGAPWGVFTSITVRLHDYPTTGLNMIENAWAGTFCTQETFETLIEKYFQLIVTLSSKWGGIANVKISATNDYDCWASTWSFSSTYYYYGVTSDQEYRDVEQKFDTLAPDPWKFRKHYNNAHALFDSTLNAPYIQPKSKTTDYSYCSSVFASRRNAQDGTTAQVLKDIFKKCKTLGACNWLWTNDITGMIGSPRESNTALSDGFRSGLICLVSWGDNDFSQEFKRIGNHSYYGHSEYGMEDWREQYWGMENYERLLKIKRKYDPKNIFWCHNCVGSEYGRLG